MSKLTKTQTAALDAIRDADDEFAAPGDLSSVRLDG